MCAQTNAKLIIMAVTIKVDKEQNSTTATTKHTEMSVFQYLHRVGCKEDLIRRSRQTGQEQEQ